MNNSYGLPLQTPPPLSRLPISQGPPFLSSDSAGLMLVRAELASEPPKIPEPFGLLNITYLHSMTMSLSVLSALLEHSLCGGDHHPLGMFGDWMLVKLALRSSGLTSRISAPRCLCLMNAQNKRDNFIPLAPQVHPTQSSPFAIYAQQRCNMAVRHLTASSGIY